MAARVAYRELVWDKLAIDNKIIGNRYNFSNKLPYYSKIACKIKTFARSRQNRNQNVLLKTYIYQIFRIKTKEISCRKIF